MNVLVDTSVWSLALRRSPASSAPEVALLDGCLEREDVLVTTGVVIQELLQGFQGPKQAASILSRLSRLPALMPDLDDHVEAARLRNHCRRHGVKIGTIDALIAQLCLRHGLRLLSADRDVDAMARHCPLELVRR